MIISKDNFVTDNMTNTVCYSSLLPAERSGLDSQLREKMYAALKESVKTLKHYDLYNTRDIWSRDYMPVQLTRDLFLNYTYSPDYLSDQKACITNCYTKYILARLTSLILMLLQSLLFLMEAM